MWLLDGIAKIPASEARVADLTLDSREVRAGSLFFALPRTQRSWPEVRGRCRRARRERGVVGACRRARAPGVAARRVRCARAELEKLGGPHCRPVLQLALLAAAHHRHHRHQRQDHLRLPAVAMPGTIGLGSRLHGHDRLGAPGGARRAHAYHAGCGHRAPHAGATAQLRRARRGDGGLLACARSGPRGRRALSSRCVHQFDPRSSRLSRQHAGVRRGQGQAVRRLRI